MASSSPGTVRCVQLSLNLASLVYSNEYIASHISDLGYHIGVGSKYSKDKKARRELTLGRTFLGGTASCLVHVGGRNALLIRGLFYTRGGPPTPGPRSAYSGPDPRERASKGTQNEPPPDVPRPRSPIPCDTASQHRGCSSLLETPGFVAVTVVGVLCQRYAATRVF